MKLKDNHIIAICLLTLLLFFIGGVLDILKHPVYLAIVIVSYIIVVINIIMASTRKQPSPVNKDTEL